MVVLTTLLSFAAILGSWKVELRVKEYFALLLILEMGVLGVFTALDFFLFFLFWEVELLPMYLLIGIWGSGRKEYSAMKFLIYTILGSAMMLVGILWLYFAAGMGTFDMVKLGTASLAGPVGAIIFLLLFFAYAVKLPIWPLHTWLPDAHVDAPTAVSVILAGVLLKMGGYAIIRICVTILPEAARTFAPYMAIFAVINILYGAVVSMVQRDLKKMVAYSSVSHMGYVLLGISALNQVGLTGATLQMFSHGTITGLLFLMVGLVYDKAHTRQIPELKGLAHRMPFIAVLFSMAGLASLGLPGMSGFVAEFLVFVGTYAVWPLPTLLAVVGIALTAGYILWMLQRVFFGPPDARWAHLGDASAVEAVPVLALMAAIILIGLYPALLTNVIGWGVLPVLSRLGS